MFDRASARVKDVVTQDHRTASVFEKYSIDFCCNGGLTIGDACAGRGIDPSAVMQELEAVTGAAGIGQFMPDSWPLDRLIDHIVGTHHAFVRRMIPVIDAHVNKIVSVHGANHPELHEIGGYIQAVIGELTAHMQKEELILFPYMRNLAEAEHNGRPPVQPRFGSIRNPIQMMEHEHQSAGDALFAVRRLSRDYTPPADACTTYRVTFKELDEFERDLHQHVHLENNILFPKAIALEDRLLDGRNTQ